jgi:hypothetical protein
MTWKGAISAPAEQLRGAHEATIAQMGAGCMFYVARKSRQAGQGYRSKARATLGPFQVYVYWEGSSKQGRGSQGDDQGNTRQDRDTTWAASMVLADGDRVWPTGKADADSTYEMVHPTYGRLRVDRVQQMSVQGRMIGYQLGLVRVS